MTFATSQVSRPLRRAAAGPHRRRPSRRAPGAQDDAQRRSRARRRGRGPRRRRSIRPRAQGRLGRRCVRLLHARSRRRRASLRREARLPRQARAHPLDLSRGSAWLARAEGGRVRVHQQGNGGRGAHLGGEEGRFGRALRLQRARGEARLAAHARAGATAPRAALRPRIPGHVAARLRARRCTRSPTRCTCRRARSAPTVAAS